MLQQLQNAWHCLQNPKTRHEYDNWLLADAALKCQQAKTQRSLQMHKPAVPAEQMPAVPPEQAAKLVQIVRNELEVRWLLDVLLSLHTPGLQPR